MNEMVWTWSSDRRFSEGVEDAWSKIIWFFKKRRFLMLLLVIYLAVVVTTGVIVYMVFEFDVTVRQLNLINLVQRVSFDLNLIDHHSPFQFGCFKSFSRFLKSL